MLFKSARFVTQHNPDRTIKQKAMTDIDRFKQMERRFKKRFTRPLKRRLKCGLARCYRVLLSLYGKTIFIGVTGSCGKTTTTELIAAILTREGLVRKGSHENTAIFVAETILSISRRHRFCVSEVSADIPGRIRQITRLLKPHIGVVTSIGQDHYSQYRSLESTAAEKGILIESLPAGGTAVLNADDPHVIAMRNRTAANVLTYGLSADAGVRGENVSAVWPNLLSLDVCFEHKRFPLQTRLLGEHQASIVLAAFAAAMAAGVSPEHAVEAVEAFEPVPYRMKPHAMPDGVTFICDNWKAPLWGLSASLDFMRKAQAKRKIAVIGTISDTPKSFQRRYRTAVRQAADAVDTLLFVGDHARAALGTPGIEEHRVMAFDTLRQLNAFLNDFLKAGDLVLIKGTENADHLQRLVHTRVKPIACWSEYCKKHSFCADCRDLYAVPESSAQTAAGQAAS